MLKRATYVMGIVSESFTRERKDRDAIVGRARSVAQILTGVQLGRRVTNGPHVAHENAPVGVYPAQDHICARLQRQYLFYFIHFFKFRHFKHFKNQNVDKF